MSKVILIPKFSKKTTVQPPDPVTPPAAEEEPNLEEFLASLSAGVDPVQESLSRNGILFLTSEVNKTSTSELIHKLWSMHFDAGFNDPIQLIINSPGGYLDAGWSLIDTMAAVRMPIRTIAIGEVASMAALIFIAGDHRVITPNARCTIHHLSSGLVGNYPALIAQRKALDIEYQKMIRHFVKFSKFKTEKQICKFLLRDQDNHLTPKEMVEAGLADNIFRPRKKKIK